MGKMAILLAADDWMKVDNYQEFLRSHPKTGWRTCGRYTPEYLQGIPYPLRVYFFHRNIITHLSLILMAVVKILQPGWYRFLLGN